MIAVVLLVIQATLGCGSEILSLNGEDWILSGPNNIYVPAHVPGGIYTDLVRNNKIDEPYYRMNDVSLQWVALANWTYTKMFKVDEDFLKHKKIELICGGLDTVAHVLLNNVSVAYTNNMFRRYIIEVTEVLKSGSNVLQIVFQSPVTYAQEQSRQYPYVVPPECPPPVQHGECYYNFIRKEACSFSWDWGPSFPSIGIWRNITLAAYEAATIRYVTAETNFVGGIWLLQLNVFFHLDSRITLLNGTLQVFIPDVGLSHEQLVTLSSGDMQLEVFLPMSRAIEEWWPNGLGKQKLYKVYVKFSNSYGDEDERTINVGFRTVELVQEILGGEEPGFSFYFKINGIPLFIKGSNWIPADSFQERITSSYLEWLLNSAAEANMNMLRVWGGGVYESEEFYDITDRLGILIWQDFMYACALYPSNDEFLENVREEVIHQVRRLKRHPSIAIWSGNNENEGVLSQNWFNVSSDKFELYKEDYRKLYIQTIKAAVEGQDVSRPFVPSSPSNGLDTAEEGWIAKDPQSIRYGDIHYYTYDGDTWDWKIFPMPRFASEFGIQSWCSLETLKPVSLPIDWDLNSDFVWHRQHHDQGNEQISNEISMHMSLPTSQNVTQKFIDFIYLSQINQAVGIKTEVEFYRRSQNVLNDGRGRTMGALYWQLNDIWQGPTWASIEYGGKWKMLHYFAKRFFSQSLISPYIEDKLVKVYYINDDNWRMKSKSFFHQSTKNVEKKALNRNARPVDVMKGQKDTVLMEMKNKTMPMEGKEEIELQIRCYHWSNLNEMKTWKTVFSKMMTTAQCIFMSRLRDMMEECHCQNPSRCFFYFTGFLHPSGLPAFPDNYLFLSSFSSIVGLRRANIQVSQLYSFNATFAEIVLSTDSISPFTWLEAVGYSGKFSDNGFLMVETEILITFIAWDPVSDWVKFRKQLTVRTLLDVYE